MLAEVRVCCPQEDGWVSCEGAVEQCLEEDVDPLAIRVGHNSTLEEPFFLTLQVFAVARINALLALLALMLETA